MAGHTVDAAVVRAWFPVMLHLEPALPSFAKPETGLIVEGQGSEHPLAIKPGGGVGLAGTVQLRDADGRFRGIAGPDHQKLEKQLTSRRIKADPVAEFPRFAGLVGQMEPIGPAYEIGCLKTVIAAFDIAHGCSESAWPRSGTTKPARDLVRRWVTEGQTDEVPIDWLLSSPYLEVIKGIDPTLARRIRAIASSAGLSTQRFDHILVARGNQRGIEAAWLVLGAEPIAFCLGSRYAGRPFCEALVSCPLAGGVPQPLAASTYDGPLINGDGTRCLGTFGCSDDAERAFRAAAERRLAAMAEAFWVSLIENERDRPEWVYAWAVEHVKGALTIDALVTGWLATVVEIHPRRDEILHEVDVVLGALQVDQSPCEVDRRWPVVPEWAKEASKLAGIALRSVSHKYGAQLRWGVGGS